VGVAQKTMALLLSMVLVLALCRNALFLAKPLTL
jgi:hypothetical protein